jgi:signal transduction histidine kinase
MNWSISPSDRIQENVDKTSARGANHWTGYSPIILVAVIGVAATWYAFRVVNNWERQQVAQEFNNNASDRVLMIRRELDLTLGVVRDVGSLFEASKWVGRRDFRKFVGPAIKRYESIVALEWIPRVKGEERAEFARDARRSFPRFRITERNPAGVLARAGQRPVHYPILFVQPYQLNKDVLGLDLASDPGILDALDNARDTGEMQVTSRILLEEDSRKGYGFAARLPVYDSKAPDEGNIDAEKDDSPDSVEQRRLMLRGFAAGVFRVGAIIERALENLRPIGIDIVIREISGNGKKEYLYRHASRKRDANTDTDIPLAENEQDKMITYHTINVMNREWEVECSSIPGFSQPELWRGWIILAGGLAFTALLSVYLGTLLGNAERVKRLVAERTLQLVEVNKTLNNEIKERINTEKDLQALNETLEERVALRTAEAEKHVNELEQFAYVTSHDLKAPLRGIANLAAWLQEDLKEKLTAATREQLNLLRDRVQRMHELIEGLLEYSRIGKTERAIENVAVGELLTEISDSLSPPPGFTIDIAPHMPTLRTERLLLYQVFSNLIGNAIRHHKGESGHVWVRAADEGESYEFIVADDGPGIAPEYHDKAFTIFQTLEARDLGSNTGIGLALVKKIVQDHGGSITLDSEEGKGATFRFTWPKHG